MEYSEVFVNVHFAFKRFMALSTFSATVPSPHIEKFKAFLQTSLAAINYLIGGGNIEKSLLYINLIIAHY